MAAILMFLKEEKEKSKIVVVHKIKLVAIKERKLIWYDKH